MSQKKIQNYFCSNSNANISESSDSDEFSIPLQKDINYYNDLLKRKSDLQKLTKVVTTNAAISECWKYFGDLHIKNRKILEKYKFCKLCLEGEAMILKSFAKSTSTTNYNHHLFNVHNIDIKSQNYKTKTAVTQNALDISSTNKSKYQNARRIAEMCCWDLQPFKIVERPGFKKFTKFLNPKMELPSDRTISTAALKDVYDVYLSHIKAILEKTPQHVTLVLDTWSDKYKHLPYINIKIHYCQDFQINVVSLKTEIFPRPHTGNAVSDKIIQALSEFNLLNKNICAVSDAGSNIVFALKKNNIPRYGCSAHSLHRFLMHDVLSQQRFAHINTIISKLKQIYRTLMYSSEELSRLQILQEQDEMTKIILEAQEIVETLESYEQFPIEDNDVTELDAAMKTNNMPTLKNSVPTRWNSLLVMIQSFLKNIKIVNIALLKVNQVPLIIPEMEKKIIKEFGKFLEIFEEATRYLQGQQYATISCCIYFLESVLCALEQLGHNSSFELTIELCDFAKQALNSRFKVMKIHVVAALLDPCQKNWPSLEKYVKMVPKAAPSSYELQNNATFLTTKESLIREEIEKINTLVEDDNQPSTSKQSLQHNSKKQKISNSRQQMLSFLSTTSSGTVDDRLEQEIKKYFNIIVQESETIDWWQQNKGSFPNIAHLANICFGIPATSASSEQAFSFAGNCINEKRSRLNPANVKMQLFVHDNRNIVEPFLSSN